MYHDRGRSPASSTFDDEPVVESRPSKPQPKVNAPDPTQVLNPSPSQSTIFDLGVDEPRRPQFTEPNDNDFQTKDLISLTDVPLSTGEHAKLYEVEVPGPDGKPVIQTKHMKILYRRGPHPTLVNINGQIVHRDEAAHLPGDPKSVMVDFITAIAYEGGVVLPIHYDVLHVFIGLWTERYKDTGIANTRIETSKAEVAKKLKIGINQRTRKFIEDALQTIRGVTITKQYESPEGSATGTGSRVEVIGGIISNYTIDRHSPEGKGGRRSDTIVVEFNPALVRAMCGTATERPWNVRSFNLSRNMNYKGPWIRQLARMVESRLDLNGRFQMPLRELMVGCLGFSETQIEDADYWRNLRFKVKEIFTDWVTSDWIQKLEWNPTTAYARGRNATEEGDVVAKVDVTMAEGRRGSVQVPRRRPNNEDLGWVRCEAGPEFTTGVDMRKSTLAMDLATATTDSKTAAASLIKRFGRDFVCDIAYGRLKALIGHMGDQLRRLNLTHWLSIEFPQPDRKHVVRIALRDWRQENEANGRVDRVPSPFHERRMLLLSSISKSKLSKYNLADFSNLAVDQAQGVDIPLLTEVKACYDLAVEAYLDANSDAGISKMTLEEANRIGDPAAERQYVKLVRTAREVAVTSAMQILWYRRIADIDLIKNLPTMNRNATERVKALTTACRRLPDAFALLKNMQAPDRNPWEAHVGSLLERRLIERAIEEDEIEKLEQRRANR